MYTDAFRNTFFVDFLEFFGLTKTFKDINNVRPSLRKSEGSNYDAERATYNSDGSANSHEVSSEVVGEKESADKNSVPQPEEKDPFLVEYSGEDDPEHPLNWSVGKRALTVAEVFVLSCVTYMGSSIYTPGQEQIQQEFHVGHVVGTLNLSMYVLGYGLGPIIFSPLSEFATIGRQQIYIWTLFGYTMLQVGCALVNNIAGLVILRFITGILCSPSLSTGGATIGDIVAPNYVPAFMGVWSIGTVCAPIIGPLLGASMVVAEDWRFIFWLLMWLSSLTLIVLVFFFPETSNENILYRRAVRLRKLTGDNRYYTLKEREESKLSFKEFIFTALYRPFEMIIKDPIVLALDLYIALCYGTFYLFFEAFPIVFVGIYNFTLIEMGLAFLGFCVGCIIAYAVCMLFLVKVVGKQFQDGTFTPETFMQLAMGVCWSLPLSLFLFGWTASVHWILPIISEIFFILCVFNLFQATFSYLAVSYPKYMASVFAGNGLMRAGFACAFPLFGRAMYNNLAIDGYPVAWGSSLLGFVSIGLAVIPFALYKYGPYLRSKSTFSG